MLRTLDHVAQPPRLDTGTPPPLLVLFHGYGANMHDLFGLAEVMDPRLHVIAAQAPIDLSQMGMPDGRAWFNLHQEPTGEIRYDKEGARESVTVAADFIEEATREIECDPARVLVMGFSQGAMLAHALLLKARVPLAGIAACSGRLVEDLIDEADTARSNVPDGMPVLLTHGTLDELIPVAHGHALRDFYETTGAGVTWVEEPIGHGIGPGGIDALATWSRQGVGL